MTHPLLSVKGLSKNYGSTKALDNVTFDVKAGEFLVVIGLSGSGKTTLLRSLNRLVDPTVGEIHFNGRRIDLLRGSEVRALRSEIGMIFQNFNLIPRHTVLDNVLMGSLARTPTWRSALNQFSAEDQALARKQLQVVGIEEKANQRADQLSGGQQQRVAIARALCQKPRLLLADEPVASLDPATCHVVMDYLRKINRELGLTVICNLHFLSLVREYATRVIALRDGKIVYEGAPNSIDAQWFKKIYGVDARDIS